LANFDRNQIELDGTRFRVRNGVRPLLASLFPPKFTTGPETRDSEQIASSWIIEDHAGGLLVKYEEEGFEDRLAKSNLESRYRNQLRLLPRSKNLFTTGHPGALYDCYTMQEYQLVGDTLSRMFAWFWASTIPASAPYRWVESTQSWLPIAYNVVNGGQLPITAPTGGLVVHTIDSTVGGNPFVDWMLQSDGEGMYLTNGTNWWYAKNATYVPRITYMVEFDGKIWGIESSTGKLWWTLDPGRMVTQVGGTAWTQEPNAIPVMANDPTGLHVFYTSGGPKLHITTKTGLYVYDEGSQYWFKSKLKWPRFGEAGRSAAEYQGDLAIGVNLSVFLFSGNSVQNIGLDQLDSIPQDQRGTIRAMADGFSWLLALVGYKNEAELVAAGEGVSYPSIFGWDKRGWHCLWRSPVITDRLGPRVLLYSLADGVPKVWWTNGSIPWHSKWMIPEGAFNPRDISTTEYELDGEAWTYWFRAKWSELWKTALSLKVKTQQLTTTEVIHVYYQLNDARDDAAWTLLKVITSADVDANGEVTLPFAGQAGLEFKSIRFRFYLTRASTLVTRTPVLLWAALKYVRDLDPLFAYSFEIDCTQETNGLSPHELEQRLEAILAKRTLVPLVYRRGGEAMGNLDTKWVRVTRWGGQAYTGTDTRGIYSMAAVEL
jgi:hypothetical protein